MRRVRYVHNDQARVGQVNLAAQRVRCSGGAWQDLPGDRGDYRFTHGGDEYRTVCEAVWRRFPTLPPADFG